METEAQVVISDLVASAAAKVVNTSLTPSQLAAEVKVTVATNSAVLSISCHAGTALGARSCAQAFANSYLANRTSIAQALVTSQLTALQNQLPGLNKQLQTLTAQIATLAANSPQRSYALAEQSVVRAQISTDNAAIGPLLLRKITAGRLLTPATLPTSATSPSRPAVLLGGLLGGLLVGVILALIVVRRDRRIHNSAQLWTQTGLPVLAELAAPLVRHVGRMSPEPGGATPLRELRDRLAAGEVSGSVLVVPLSASAGGSLVAVNLAASLSADGSTCALVCASPDSLSTLRLGIPPAPGLSDALTFGYTDVSGTLTHLNNHHLGVLPPGRQPKALLDLLHSKSMLALLGELRKHYDHLVVEAPVWSKTRSALVLGQAAEAVILVAETHLTSLDDALEAAQTLAESGVAVQGVVLLPHLRGAGLAGHARSGRHANNAAFIGDDQGAPSSAAGTKPGDASPKVR